MSQILNCLSSSLRWSTLAKVGSLPVIRLTVLVPLVGIVLLFNEQVVTLLSLSQAFLKDIGVSEGSDFSINNLYFTYFGLCFLGVGSVVFAFCCPEDINGSGKLMDYVIASANARNSVLAKNNLEVVLYFYYKYLRDDTGCQHKQSPEYPKHLDTDFQNLMQALSNAAQRDDCEDLSPYPEITATGYPNYHSVAEALKKRTAAHKVYWIPLWDAAPSVGEDIAFLKFKTLDYSMFWARISISVLYFFGFIILSVPTVKVFFLVIGHVFGFSY